MALKPGMHIKDRTAEVERAIRSLPEQDVLVGIPAEENPREGGGIGNAALGYIHENGAPEVGIPARPWLIPGIRNDRANIAKYLGQAARAALEGKEGLVERALHAAGFSATISVQRKLHTGPFVPLRPGTIAARRRRSAGSSYRRKATTAADVKPLIDTAQMLRAVVHVVRTKGE
jgi:hypothetical protein